LFFLLSSCGSLLNKKALFTPAKRPAKKRGFYHERHSAGPFSFTM